MTVPSGGVASGSKDLEAIWTRIVIDPIADRVVRPLVGLRWVTPNRITAVAGLMAVISAACFLTGHLVIGGVLFQLRFLIDCLDGRLARIRQTSTTWGAAFDLLVDTVGILLNYAALAAFVASSGVAGASSQALVAAVVVTCGIYCWTLAHRKSLPGGGQHDWLAHATATPGRSPRERYVAFMARHRMVPTPYAVEIEALALTLLPLTTSVTLAAAGLWIATAFYVAASALNVYRTWRLAQAIDRQAARAIDLPDQPNDRLAESPDERSTERSAESSAGKRSAS